MDAEQEGQATAGSFTEVDAGMDAAEFYRRARNLPEDWDVDWGSTEWNWFQIGWNAYDLAQHMSDQDIADCFGAFHATHERKVNGHAPFANVLHAMGWLFESVKLAR